MTMTQESNDWVNNEAEKFMQNGVVVAKPVCLNLKL